MFERSENLIASSQKNPLINKIDPMAKPKGKVTFAREKWEKTREPPQYHEIVSRAEIDAIWKKYEILKNEFDKYKIENNRDKHAMKLEIEYLRSKLQMQDINSIQKMNEFNIKRLEDLFDLPPPTDEPIEEKIKKMEGFLKKYSDNDPDPVDILLKLRNHE